MANDELFQQISTVQSSLQPTSPTIAAAATIAPTTLITFLTGTTQVANITPPVTGSHVLILIFTNASPGATLTTGNIKNALTPAQNIPVIAVYDLLSNQYWLK